MRQKHPTEKRPAQILFSKNTYKPNVKVENWYFANDTEKKDNHVYRDRLSNHISTYTRWGTEDQGCRMTETRHMLAQIFTKTDPIYSFKPLVNFTSYPCTDTPGRNKLMKKADLAQLPPDFGVMDYLTSQQDDYRNPHPAVTKPVFYYFLLVRGTNICLHERCCTPGRNKLMKKADLAQLPPDFGVMDYLTSQQDDYRNPHPAVTKPLTMSSPPWLLNRVIRSDLTHNHGTAPPRGDYQCLDTHTPIGHIRQMRLFRRKSFDPATCLQSFPDPDLVKPLDGNQNKS